MSKTSKGETFSTAAERKAHQEWMASNPLAGDWKPCKQGDPRFFRCCKPYATGHKYAVKHVTTSVIPTDTYKRVSVTYCDSISSLLSVLNQFNEYIERVNAEWYNTMSNGYITAHYVTKEY